MSRKHHVPKYRRHKASGQAAVVLGRVWHYLGAYGSPESRERYERLVSEWLSRGRTHAVDPHPELTVSAVIAAYLDHAGQRVGWSQLARIRRAMGVVRRLYGSARAADFRGRALKAVRAELVAGKGNRPHNRRHVNQLVGCVKQCWRWALSEELVPAGAAQSVLAVAGLRRGEGGAAEPEPVPPVDPDVVEATLPHLPPVVADVVRVQVHTGMRPGEAVRLRADEIDRVAEDLWVWRPGRHKTAHHGHRRQVFLGPRAIAVVERHLAAAGGGYVFSPRRAEAERLARLRAARKTRVQPSQADRRTANPRKAPGERYDRNSYCRAIARACKRAGVPHWHPGQLRHLAATRVVAEYGWEVARIYLGHRHIDTTRIYAEDSLERVGEAVRAMG